MYRCTPYRRPGGLAAGKPYRRPNPPSLCRTSRVFDEHHLQATGFVCYHKHTVYRWQGTAPRCATLVCDSLGKWLRNVKYTDIQSIPGLTLEKAVTKINDYTLHLAKYPIILLMVGTNNVTKYEPEQIVEKLKAMVEAVTNKNPTAKLAYCAIIFRPCDVPEQMAIIRRRPPKHLRGTNAAMAQPSASATVGRNPPDLLATPTIPAPVLTSRQKYDALPYMEKKRRRINKAIRKYCDANSIFFLQSWKAMELMDKSVNIPLFADDGLHLEEPGIEALKGHIEGNVSTLIDARKQFIKKKNKKQTKKSKSEHIE